MLPAFEIYRIQPCKRIDKFWQEKMTQNQFKFNFKQAAALLISNNYEPLTVAERERRPLIKDWTKCDLSNLSTIEALMERHRSAGVGLRCGSLIVVDIDRLNRDASHAIRELALKRFGTTPLIRHGNRPK